MKTGIEKWKLAYSNTNIPLEQQKELYERHALELKESVKGKNITKSRAGDKLAEEIFFAFGYNTM